MILDTKLNCKTTGVCSGGARGGGACYSPPPQESQLNIIGISQKKSANDNWFSEKQLLAPFERFFSISLRDKLSKFFIQAFVPTHIFRSVVNKLPCYQTIQRFLQMLSIKAHQLSSWSMWILKNSQGFKRHLFQFGAICETLFSQQLTQVNYHFPRLQSILDLKSQWHPDPLVSKYHLVVRLSL